ncbi:nucleotidyltransferase domain-containing protein [Parabacteroides johnsonii]|uniref:nucleotidyltransferase domain-containing protein n=1 Tax=Parabacteroides johnsonii TaxID=387661 RepID=UPI0011DCF4C2|nr:nucleotidyltransferase domain-containing protein [Parabacteroides johnsonii]MBP3640442.1 nucleotidyltransferase domain-containing protein [Parabacteroides sp.]
MRRTGVVEQIRKVVQEVAHTAKAILFGSEARGDARPDSDIDLLILMDGDKLPLEREESVTLPLYELELKTGVTINPIIMLKKLWDNRPFKTPFYINIVNEGIVL